MSYNLAVWEGPRPVSSEQAAAEFERLYERYVGAGDPTPPTPSITAFVKTLTSTYPCMSELADDRVDESPWSDSPLINNAIGPFFYFGVSYSRVDEVLPFVLETAQKQRLVCFDPQSGKLV